MNYTLANHPVTRDFMYMTKYTTPHGTEHETFYNLLTARGFTMDEAGNYFASIGESDTLFIAHMDTADRERKRVRRTVNGTIVTSDGSTILGADDKAGCAVLLHLWRNKVPGNYLFVVGEERGMIGSKKFAADLEPYKYMRAIAWDRMGYDSIITHQMGERGCSETFASALADEYERYGVGLVADSGGSYTDTYAMFDFIPECTNISVGYFNQHTNNECQDVEALVNMAEASVCVEWEALPVAQDPTLRDEMPRYTPWGKGKDKYWEWDDEGYLYDAEPALDVDELYQHAQYGTLRYSDVEKFVRVNPDDAAPLLYDLLTNRGY